MKGRKKTTYFGAVILGLVLLTTSVSVLGTDETTTTSSVPVTYHEGVVREESIPLSTVHPMQMLSSQNPGGRGTDIQVTVTPEVDNNPTIAAEPLGALLLAYTHEVDITENNVVYGFSTDGGQTFDPGIYYNLLGTESHPALDYRGVGTQIVGTMQCDPIESNGAIQYLFQCTDILDYNTYELRSWDWTSYPYSNRRIPDMGGYAYPGIDWWAGVTTCVGTRDSPGSVDMPIFNYCNYVDPNSGWSSYHATYSGCENTAVDVDPTTAHFCAVFDYNNPSTSSWDLLIFRGNCTNDGSGSLHYFTPNIILGGAENTKYPAVATQADKYMILAQTDSAGNQDIVCYYSSDGGATWDMSVVADSTNDETSPTIVSYGDDATATFMMNGDLYVTYTEDGGINWDAPTLVNDNAGTVEAGFRNSEITSGGVAVWADTRNGEPDVYLDTVGGTPAHPIITLGDFKGGLGKVSIPVKNIGDEDATDIDVVLTVKGGILGRINASKTETISLAVNDEVTITTDGFIFGLGAVQLFASATCADAIPTYVEKSASGKVLIIFVTGIA
ncbi:MAG: hypothetical protein JXA00_01460 [Candidatus Thermoplasmatota archaeon]|nr:hypothetical protein [Candidatus Thermoplasmatota archaeon]